MYGRGRSGIMSLANYAAAKHKYETTKHIRGRDTEERPLGDRRKPQFQIRKRGDDIACRCYDTDVVLYHPDNTITLHVPIEWRTGTTATFIREVLGRHRTSTTVHDHDIILSLRGRNAQHLRVGETVRLQIENNEDLTLLSNSTQHFVHSVDRKRMNALRKTVKPFRDYLRATLKLREGRFNIEEADVLRDFLRDNDIYPDALGPDDGWNVKKYWSLDLPGDRWFNHYAGDALAAWKERAAKMVRLMQTGSTEEFYPMTVWLAYTTKTTGTPSSFNCALVYMENVITDLLIATHPEVLMRRSEAAGEIERDRYARFNFLFEER